LAGHRALGKALGKAAVTLLPAGSVAGQALSGLAVYNLANGGQAPRAARRNDDL